MDESINNWMKDWLKLSSKTEFDNSFNENSDEWVVIDGVGKFKGLEIITENNDDISNITITLKYDIWDKNVL